MSIEIPKVLHRILLCGIVTVILSVSLFLTVTIITHVVIIKELVCTAQLDNILKQRRVIPQP